MSRRHGVIESMITRNDVLSCLQGRCSPGVIKRVSEGGIPDRGSGRWSVPNALAALRYDRNSVYHRSGIGPGRFGKKIRFF